MLLDKSEYWLLLFCGSARYVSVEHRFPGEPQRRQQLVYISPVRGHVVVMWRAQSAPFGHVLRSVRGLASRSVTRVIRNGVIIGDFRGPAARPQRFSGPTPRPVSCSKRALFPRARICFLWFADECSPRRCGNGTDISRKMQRVTSAFK